MVQVDNAVVTTVEVFSLLIKVVFEVKFKGLCHLREHVNLLSDQTLALIQCFKSTLVVDDLEVK